MWSHFNGKTFPSKVPPQNTTRGNILKIGFLSCTEYVADRHKYFTFCASFFLSFFCHFCAWPADREGTSISLNFAKVTFVRRKFASFRSCRSVAWTTPNMFSPASIFERIAEIFTHPFCFCGWVMQPASSLDLRQDVSTERLAAQICLNDNAKRALSK